MFSRRCFPMLSNDVLRATAPAWSARVGLTATRWLVESSVCPELFTSRGLESVRPSEAERQEIHRIIMSELVAGVFLPGAVAFLQGVIRQLASHGCDSVALACTEI